MDNKEKLWQEYKRTKSPEIRHQLILSYLWLVKYLAGRLAVKLPACMSQEDLESCGIFGLIEAIDKFDPDMGCDFEAYASIRVRGAMLDEVRRANWMPRTLWYKLQRLRATRERLENMHQEKVSMEAVAQEMGISQAEVHYLDNQLYRLFTLSLDEMVAAGNGEPVRLGDLLPDETSPDPLDRITEEENKELLARAVASLPEKDRLVLALYYQEGLTLKEIGAVLEVSESRVCQLHSRAINRLRKKLAELS
ncbi:FliA/WhiG family RNA polymerase sigma factor [Desulfofundulus salinus]|uniref:FliA/WhiG family RNA polymerase sigma factor n=1 Tax=Desulfofundulus salinus TaxID=2419843 RepID=A0A494WVJ8_9FIRM|nr:FliA/WhiG family RNA polymerase sigma factor [Desulfofundulus salinum]RKO66923.1 FliA/WhiG family RNA polymerase sigma factor [Desulfofundulus salinum]